MLFIGPVVIGLFCANFYVPLPVLSFAVDSSSQQSSISIITWTTVEGSPFSMLSDMKDNEFIALLLGTAVMLQLLKPLVDFRLCLEATNKMIVAQRFLVLIICAVIEDFVFNGLCFACLSSIFLYISTIFLICGFGLLVGMLKANWISRVRDEGRGGNVVEQQALMEERKVQSSQGGRPLEKFRDAAQAVRTFQKERKMRGKNMIKQLRHRGAHQQTDDHEHLFFAGNPAVLERTCFECKLSIERALPGDILRECSTCLRSYHFSCYKHPIPPSFATRKWQCFLCEHREEMSAYHDENQAKPADTGDADMSSLLAFLDAVEAN